MLANEAKEVNDFFCGAGEIWEGFCGHDTRMDIIDCLPVPASYAEIVIVPKYMDAIL